MQTFFPFKTLKSLGAGAALLINLTGAIGCGVETPAPSGQASGERFDEPASKTESSLACAGPLRKIDGTVGGGIDYNGFRAFLAARQMPIHPVLNGEIRPGVPMFLGAPDRVTGSARLETLRQYLAWKRPGLAYCEVVPTYRSKHCPQPGRVLFLEPANGQDGLPIPQGHFYLRSESDEVNCPVPGVPACPAKPQSCYGRDFGERTVTEIWVR